MDFAYFSPVPWDFIWQRQQSICVELARLGHKVFFVDPVRPLVKHVLSGRGVGISPTQHGVAVVRPLPQFLGSRGPVWTWGVEDSLTRRCISRLLRRALSDSSVAIVGSPNWAERVDWDRVPHGLLCYDCIDFTEGMFSGRKAAEIRRMEDALISKSDIVFATHPALVERIAAGGKKAYLVPNGANVEKFTSADIPQDLVIRSIPHPIVGYVGAITKWLDQDLIQAAARRCPECSFVLIGPTIGQEPRRGLLDLPNIYRLGQKSHDEVASYVRIFDVCIIPFKAGPIADHTDPVKVYEYLAGGKPVVAANIPALDHLGNLVYSTKGKDAFLTALSQALDENSPDMASARVEYARANSWEARAELMVDIVASEIDQRTKC